MVQPGPELAAEMAGVLYLMVLGHFNQPYNTYSNTTYVVKLTLQEELAWLTASAVT